MIFNNLKIEIVRSKRKTLALQVTRDAKVVVRSPLHFSEQKIIEFISLHYDWLQNAISKQSNRTNLYAVSDEQLAVLKQKAKEKQ